MFIIQLQQEKTTVCCDCDVTMSRGQLLTQDQDQDTVRDCDQPYLGYTHLLQQHTIAHLSHSNNISEGQIQRVLIESRILYLPKCLMRWWGAVLQGRHGSLINMSSSLNIKQKLWHGRGESQWQCVSRNYVAGCGGAIAGPAAGGARGT